jgi:hypothetical protein
MWEKYSQNGCQTYIRAWADVVIMGMDVDVALAAPVDQAANYMGEKSGRGFLGSKEVKFKGHEHDDRVIARKASYIYSSAANMTTSKARILEKSSTFCIKLFKMLIKMFKINER